MALDPVSKNIHCDVTHKHSLTHAHTHNLFLVNAKKFHSKVILKKNLLNVFNSNRRKNVMLTERRLLSNWLKLWKKKLFSFFILRLLVRPSRSCTYVLSGVLLCRYISFVWYERERKWKGENLKKRKRNKIMNEKKIWRDSTSCVWTGLWNTYLFVWKNNSRKTWRYYYDYIHTYIRNIKNYWTQKVMNLSFLSLFIRTIAWCCVILRCWTGHIHEFIHEILKSFHFIYLKYY